MWLEIYENYMNTKNSVLQYSYMPLGMINKELKDIFAERDLLRQHEDGCIYSKVIFLQVVLGACILLFSFQIDVNL
jgi:hypothetical protein